VIRIKFHCVLVPVAGKPVEPGFISGARHDAVPEIAPGSATSALENPAARPINDTGFVQRIPMRQKKLCSLSQAQYGWTQSATGPRQCLRLAPLSGEI
jgi:hypothetical protein